MLKLFQRTGISICVLTLSACIADGTDAGHYYWDSPPTEDTQLYPEGYDANDTPSESGRGTKTVVVPQSYHLGPMNSPVTSKDADQEWVDNQSPNGYTIQIANDTKPSQVANKLYMAPKSEHSAEVKSQSGSYLGLYGSYPTREAAEAQLNTLPPEVKDGAQIKNWSNVQNEVLRQP